METHLLIKISIIKTPNVPERRNVSELKMEFQFLCQYVYRGPIIARSWGHGDGDQS